MKATTQTAIQYGSEKQTGDDGQPVIAWWFFDDPQNEPVAGGYSANEADARSDASIWLSLHPEYVERA